MPRVLDPAAALLKALHFAADMHREQMRKGVDATPYINHPIEVAELLARVGGVTDVVTLQAAILHDTVEDTDATLDDVERAFGRAVRDIVGEVSDDKSLEKEERMRLQVARAPSLSAPAKLIKIADKTCNVRDITHFPPVEWPLERRMDYVEWSARVVDGCRGCNVKLEAYYDRVLAESRSLLAGLSE